MNDRLIQKIAEIKKQGSGDAQAQGRNPAERETNTEVAKLQAAADAKKRAERTGTDLGAAAAGDVPDGAIDPGFTVGTNLGRADLPNTPGGATDPKLSVKGDNSLSEALGIGAGAVGGGALGAGAGAALAPHIGIDRTIATLAGLFGGGAGGATLAYLFVKMMNERAQNSAEASSPGDVARYRKTTPRSEVRHGKQSIG